MTMKMLRVVLPQAARESLSDRLTENPHVTFWQVWDVRSRFVDGHAFAGVADRVAGYTSRVCFEILANEPYIEELVQSLSACPMCSRGHGLFWILDVAQTGIF